MKDWQSKVINVGLTLSFAFDNNFIIIAAPPDGGAWSFIGYIEELRARAAAPKPEASVFAGAAWNAPANSAPRSWGAALPRGAEFHPVNLFSAALLL